MDEHNIPTTTEDLINMLLSEGLGEGLPKVAEISLNAAMLIERTRHMGAAPYQRVDAYAPMTSLACWAIQFLAHSTASRFIPHKGVQWKIRPSISPL